MDRCGSCVKQERRGFNTGQGCGGRSSIVEGVKHTWLTSHIRKMRLRALRQSSFSLLSMRSYNGWRGYSTALVGKQEVWKCEQVRKVELDLSS